MAQNMKTSTFALLSLAAISACASDSDATDGDVGKADHGDLKYLMADGDGVIDGMLVLFPNTCKDQFNCTSYNFEVIDAKELGVKQAREAWLNDTLTIYEHEFSEHFDGGDWEHGYDRVSDPDPDGMVKLLQDETLLTEADKLFDAIAKAYKIQDADGNPIDDLSKFDLAKYEGKWNKANNGSTQATDWLLFTATPSGSVMIRIQRTDERE